MIYLLGSQVASLKQYAIPKRYAGTVHKLRVQGKGPALQTIQSPMYRCAELCNSDDRK